MRAISAGLDANGFSRADYDGLIRAGVRSSFRPEAYFLAACASGRYAGLPWGAGCLRALGLVEGPAAPFVEALRLVRYLDNWRHRGSVERWSPGAIYLAALMPARLPWAEVPDHVLVARDRWPEAYRELAYLDTADRGHVTIADLHLHVERARMTIAYHVAEKGLRAARLGRMGVAHAKGSAWRRLLVQYQAKRGLTPSGEWDAETDAALYTSPLLGPAPGPAVG